MTAQSFPPSVGNPWYWTVNGSSPTTQVYSLLDGGFVGLSNAGFLSWLTAGGALLGSVGITGAVSNGAGGTRLTVTTTTDYQNGLKMNVSGTTLYDGNNLITVIDGTHLDIPVAYAGPVSTGIVAGATIIDTFAHLMSVINSVNTALLPTPSPWAAPTQSSSGSNIVLTNPLKVVTVLTNNHAGGSTIVAYLPQMNQQTSIPIGIPFWIVNDKASNGPISIQYQDQSTGVPPWGTTSSIPPGGAVQFVLTDNSTPNGTVLSIGVSSESSALPLTLGGTGTDMSGFANRGVVWLANGASGSLQSLVSGTAGQDLRQVSGGNPAWSNPATGGHVSGAFPTNINYSFILYVDGALSAPITFTLPVANTVAAGTRCTVVDPQGRVSATNTVSVNLGVGTDKLNGSVGGVLVAINHAFGWASFVSDGISAWSSADGTDASNLSIGTIPAGVLPAFTGDVTKPSGSTVTTLANIPNETTMAGDILATNIVAPATPAAGKNRLYFDSTSKNIAAKNDGGTINHGIQTKAAVSHNFLTSIADDGSSVLARPTPADLNPNAIATITQQIFNANGTYTPTTGMLFAIVEVIAGGGGGGGTVGSSTAARAGGGGGSGSYSRSIVTAAQVVADGGTEAITVGAKGSGGAAGAHAGQAGGASSFGSRVTTNGGNGGNFSDLSTGFGERGTGGAAGTGTVAVVGNPGGSGLGQGTITTILANGGTGGASWLLGGGTGAIAISGSNNAGSAGASPGAGGGGAATVGVNSNANGGDGVAGVVIVTEFCNQ